jgi:hypothetical protein
MIRPPTEKTLLTEYDRQLMSSVPFLTGKEVTLTVAASFATQKLPHGLGRPYRGAWQLWASTLSRVNVHDPAAQDDSATNVTVTDVTGIGGDVRVWIF